MTPRPMPMPALPMTAIIKIVRVEPAKAVFHVRFGGTGGAGLPEGVDFNAGFDGGIVELEPGGGMLLGLATPLDRLDAIELSGALDGGRALVIEDVVRRALGGTVPGRLSELALPASARRPASWIARRRCSARAPKRVRMNWLRSSPVACSPGGSAISSSRSISVVVE